MGGASHVSKVASLCFIFDNGQNANASVLFAMLGELVVSPTLEIKKSPQKSSEFSET